jgi:hypothetical protein
MLLDRKEEILIKIDPSDLSYSVEISFIELDNIYITLRDIIHQLETGTALESFNLTNTMGEQTLDREQYRQHIRNLKRGVDEYYQSETTLKSVGTFRD